MGTLTVAKARLKDLGKPAWLPSNVLSLDRITEVTRWSCCAAGSLMKKF